jgi:hypothetical protein
MSTRSVTLVRTGKRVERCAARLLELFQIARELCRDGFPAEETRDLDALLAHVTLAYVDALRKEVAEQLALEERVLSRDLFSIHGCGPVSLHDDKFRYPGVYFVIIVANSGRLGLVDRTSRAVRHEVGDIVLLDPYKKHALVPEGLRARDHPYERTHSPVHAEEDQFFFLDFDVPRPLLRERFRTAGEKK